MPGVGGENTGRSGRRGERARLHEELPASDCPRLAPMAERTTISRPRASARARNSPATFTHAMSSTNPTAPSSTNSGVLTLPAT